MGCDHYTSLESDWCDAAMCWSSSSDDPGAWMNCLHIPSVIERICCKSWLGAQEHEGIAISASDSGRKPLVFQGFVSSDRHGTLHTLAPGEAEIAPFEATAAGAGQAEKKVITAPS